jgi:hypothetical protein
VSLSPTFLVVRREDLVVLGVRWSGFELRHDAADPASRPHLAAVGDDAFVMLIFPPQAIVEGKITTSIPDAHFGTDPAIMTSRPHPSVTRVQSHARLADHSVLVFEVQRGTLMGLTAEGILQALSSSSPGARIVPVAGLGESLAAQVDIFTEHDPDAVDAVLGGLNIEFFGGARDLDRLIDIPGERDVGIRIAQRILDRRRELDGDEFRDLDQVLSVPLIGPKRFAQIVYCLGVQNELIGSSGAGALVSAGEEPGLLVNRFGTTSIEIPWRLYMAPKPQASSTTVSDHSDRPVERSGVFGLWHARLRASNGDATDAKLRLAPLNFGIDVIEEDTKFHFSPLSGSERHDIVELGRQSPPVAKRLELSALGGSLSVTGRWPGVDWDHDATLGRDQRVRVKRQGFLYPFGHRAQYEEVTERVLIRVVDPSPPTDFEPGEDEDEPEGPPTGLPTRAVAGLTKRGKLTVTEPVRRGVLAPGFPFSEVEILRDTFIAARPGDEKVFKPLEGGKPLRFPLRCAAAGGDVHFAMPLVFVSDGSSPTTDTLVATLGADANVELPGGTQIDLLHSPLPRMRQPGDVHEVHQLSFTGDANFSPKLRTFEVKLPALRTLLPDHDLRRPLVYSKAFLGGGLPEIALEPPEGGTFGVDFTKHADRSGGLVSPRFNVHGIHRTLGPVPPMDRPDLSEVYPGATLLGFPLHSLINVAGSAKPEPPAIVQSFDGLTPSMQMTWKLDLTDSGAFGATPNSTKLTLMVGGTPPNAETTCTVENFQLLLPSRDTTLLKLSFGSVVFTQKLGQAPDLLVNKLEVDLAGDLALLQDIQNKVKEAIGQRGDRPTITTAPDKISAGYGFSLPKVPAAMFVLQNIATRIGVDVPFKGDPVTVSLAFASRDNPFSLTVMAFGGGGYIDVQIGGRQGGLTQLEVSLEFGGMVAIGFVIGSAEVHALGGVRYLQKPDGSFGLAGYIRIGGSVDVLGLVSVAVELLVTLRFEAPPPKLVGRAALVIEIELFTYPTTVTFDSGEYELVGGGGAALDRRGDQPALDLDAGLRAWREYRQAFAAP